MNTYMGLRIRKALLLCGMMMAALPAALLAQGEQPVDSTSRDAVLEVGAAPLSVPNVRAKVRGGGYYMMHTVPTTLGATVGGAQDIGYARRLIESGRIPQFIDFSPEGLYSEHDIPTPASQCDAKLCLSLGYGYAPTADNNSNAIFLHLGMNSNIKADEFHRSPLQLALVIDKSGSMDGSNMEAVKIALKRLVERLGADDEVLLVEFNDDARLVLPAIRGSERERLLKAIESLTADGGTDIEAGLTMGFDQLNTMPSRGGAQKRLMLFTDAMPNAGRTDSTSFRALTERYAKDGIGLTAFGVGIDFGQELAYHISQLRGGNFFYLESPEKIAKVFDTEFDYLVTPLVYDLDVKIETPDGLKLTAVYGLPTWKPGSKDAELHIPTVFLSSNRGAIVLRYERDGEGVLRVGVGEEIASGRLAFTETDGRRHSEETVVRHTGVVLEPGTQFYTHDGMRMAVALTNVYFGLRDGCKLMVEGRRKDAVDAISRARGVAKLENVLLADSGLADEIKLLDRLQENIEKGSDVREPASAPDR